MCTDTLKISQCYGQSGNYLKNDDKALKSDRNLEYIMQFFTTNAERFWKQHDGKITNTIL